MVLPYLPGMTPRPLGPIRPGVKMCARRFRPLHPRDQLIKTVKLIGEQIKKASTHPPLRVRAAQIATRAGWKNYREQLHHLYRFIMRRYRYVRDPIGLELVAGGPAAWNLTAGATSPTGYGHGDCDDVTVLAAGMAQAIGMKARIVIMAPPGRRNASHVYAEIQIPDGPWIPFDPVAWPRIGFGKAAPAQWRARFDLDGNRIGQAQGGAAMRGLGDVNGWQDYGLARYGLAGLDGEEPLAFNDEVISDFGSLAGTYGVIDNPGFLAEVDEITQDGLALTPIMELSLSDFAYVSNYGTPYVGMFALGSDGDTYQYVVGPDGIGFFKKIFKGARKLVKGALRKVKKIGRKVLKALPGGKILLKLHDKLYKASMKLIKPLAKFVGPLAKKLAPIAMFVPGFGPAIAAALYTTGRFASLAQKFGVQKDAKGRPKFKNKAQAKAFKAAAKKEAAKAKREGLDKKQGLYKKGTAAHREKIKSTGAKPDAEAPAAPEEAAPPPSPGVPAQEAPAEAAGFYGFGW